MGKVSLAFRVALYPSILFGRLKEVFAVLVAEAHGAGEDGERRVTPCSSVQARQGEERGGGGQAG